MRLKDFIKVQCRANFIRLKIGCINFYLANHAMQVIQFEKKARQKKRRKMRGMALDRANHQCEICGCAIDWITVSIHHIKPRVHYPDLEFDPDNIQALCLSCHQHLHEMERLQASGLAPMPMETP
ncbi:MAG: HNH endonuclease [Muribaculaceae bacterium]|nr:HNH endonuclease [Muribaculaceae bacterium]